MADQDDNALAHPLQDALSRLSKSLAIVDVELLNDDWGTVACSDE